MKTSPSKRFPRGFVSFLLVLTTGAILTMLMIYAYRSALHSQDVQSQVQMRVDYSEKEEAILRSIVAITPNRAILAMQGEDELKAAKISPDMLSWESIFTDSLEQANARTSIRDDLKTSLGIADLKSGNLGDSKVPGLPRAIFQPALAPVVEGSFVSAGINRAKVSGYPAALTTSDTTTSSQDVLYPIISDHKMAGKLAAGTTPNFEVLKYPKINFGYATPGEDFVAKRNWWAFSVDAGAQDGALTHLARKKRNFVLSIYEIPSQLAISASSFMALGQYADGTQWKNVDIQGGLFVGKAQVDANNTPLAALSSRRSMTLAAGTTIGGRKDLGGGDPFAQGFRETDQVASKGAVLPVSLASESGRAAFIPINRGELFFDRHAHPASEKNAQSTTTWNNYSIGALQCAMRLDIKEVNDVTKEPMILSFQCYGMNGERADPVEIVLTRVPLNRIPSDYKEVADGVEPLPGQAVDLAYKVGNVYYFEPDIKGVIDFAGTFGLTGGVGYYRPRCPISIKRGVQVCVSVEVERFPAFLKAIGAAPVGPGGEVAPHYNNSLVVNVDYSNIGLNFPLKPDSLKLGAEVGVVLTDCGDLTAYTSGFSLVTNLRLFVGDNFNNVPIPGSNPEAFPPCSLFSPERRIGFERDPLAVELRGQIGSLASETNSTAVRPLDSKKKSGEALSADHITVNLSKIKTTAELPPITMMNWLVLMEEVR